MPTELSRLLLLCKLFKLFWHFVREFLILVKIWKMTHAVVLQQSTGSKIHPRQTTNHKRNDISLLPAGNTLWVLHCYIPYIVTRYLYRWHPVAIHQEHKRYLRPSITTKFVSVYCFLYVSTFVKILRKLKHIKIISIQPIRLILFKQLASQLYEILELHRRN